MDRKVPSILALLLIAGAHAVVGQPDGQEGGGIPFPSQHYAPPEYQQSPQNWDIVQDDRGLIYVANNDGVLQYDGERWRLIPTTTGTFARSLATDSLVFVGAKGDFGYLRPDSLGVLRYRSLYEHVPEETRDFKDVWGTHVLGDGVYYQSNQYLFRWDGTEITSWSSGTKFHTSFVAGGTLYVREQDRGLLRMQDDSLEVVPGGEAFRETPIYMMARHPDGDLLVATQNEGLLLYNGTTFRPFAPGLTSYFQEKNLYHGRRLPGNRYALATLKGGVLVIDAEGEVVHALDGSSLLPDKVVNHVFADREGQLWMALNSGGVFRVNLNTPLTLHDERTGLNGAVRGVYQPNDALYVATGSGLYVLRDRVGRGLGKQGHFERWKSLPLVWDMIAVNGDLLVATQTKGAFEIDGRDKRRIADWAFTYDFSSPADTEIVYAGTRSGLKGLRQGQDGWTSFPISGVQGEIRSLAIEEPRTLWMSTTEGTVVRGRLSGDRRRVTSITRYGEQEGLPKGAKGVSVVNERVTVWSKRGFFRIDNLDRTPDAWEFARSASLLPDIEGGEETDAPRVNSFQVSGDTFWVIVGDRVFMGHHEEKGVSDWKNVDFLNFSKSEDTRLFVGRDSTLWLGDQRRLFRYPLARRAFVEPQTASFSALVRQVTTLRRKRVVYGGHSSGLAGDSSLTVPYGRDVRVDVAAPLYGPVEAHEYRYKLAGRTDGWTDWTGKASQRYRNLWEGTYHFRVQARNDRGRISKTASLTLNVLPPWYRSVWAYFFYGLSFVAVAYGYRRYYQIKKEKRRARKRVRELERERVVAKRLKKANERLREANRLKEDFLATTSHELRTPLTNILGALEVLRDTVNGEHTEFLNMIEQNGQRLKRTLNALLDISMLRSGNEDDVRLSPTALGPCVRRVASDLREDAAEKGLALRVETPDAPVRADVNDQYLEQILCNLIENAIKYTHEGHVAVSVGRASDRACTAYIEVEDTGIGIDEEFLPDLFEEFKQESRGRGRTYEGNGLGLAISARLAEQMNGHIRVETEKDEGSTFTVEFPQASEETADQEEGDEP